MPKRRIILVVLAVLCFAGAAGLTVYNLNEDRHGGQESLAIAEELNLQLRGVEHTTIRSESQLEVYNIQHIDDQEEEASEKPETTKSFYSVNRVYLGLITIPKLNLQLPVQEELSNSNLKVSPCRIYGSPEKQNLVIAGHNYRTHFSKLKKLKEGDEVSVTLIDGTTYVYYVDALEVVEPTDVNSVTSGEWPLSLVTCTLGGKSRLVVHCDMAEE